MVEAWEHLDGDRHFHIWKMRDSRNTHLSLASYLPPNKCYAGPSPNVGLPRAGSLVAQSTVLISGRVTRF